MKVAAGYDRLVSRSASSISNHDDMKDDWFEKTSVTIAGHIYLFNTNEEERKKRLSMLMKIH